MENLWNGSFLNDTQKTFKDIVSEALGDEDWLRKNIRESIKENAEVWKEMAKL